MSFPIATGSQMREVDRITIEERGIPGLVLMENAGTGVANAIKRRYSSLKDKNITVVSGKGNNGGDGYVVARLLLDECNEMNVFVLAEESALKGDALENYKRIKEAGAQIYHLKSTSEFDEEVMSILKRTDIIVDAILGTGITGEVKGFYGEVINLINDLRKDVVSVDISSGLSSDTGKISGPAIFSNLTVTLGMAKIAHFVYPAAKYAGDLEIVDIGIPDDVIENMKFDVEVIEKEDVRKILPQREKDAHKGNFGHTVIIGGSVGKSGAVIMAAEAAMRSGAGLVTAVVPKGINTVIEANLIEAMSFPVEENKNGAISKEAVDSILDFCRDKDVVAAGPGMGADKDGEVIIEALLKNLDMPLVLDADAINILSKNKEILRERKGEVILTPHPGEMGRLMGIKSSDVQKERLEVCIEAAKDFDCIVVLKGKNSIISNRGKKTFINTTGNPGMATGGSGDVLTGIIAGLLSQGVPSEYSASCGVFIHGLAGDIAAEDIGEVSLCAGDVIDYLPEAFLRCLTC
ncbi:MAG: NAD(P)H-hydrate dehydratase [Candidatus Schekmanbacteria bacterium]|nr:MAG: NAD(P)H-hydrate dehydratase [Candidatus Schekmanbacteria bacterium]